MIPLAARSIMSSRQEPPDSLDAFFTPPWATRAFCALLQERGDATRFHSAWDCACGQGHMTGPLEDFFGPVIGSDIFNHGGVREPAAPGWWRDLDFLDETAATPVVDWIITNPPFNTSVQFVRRALSLAKIGVAMLVRTAWLGGKGRHCQLFSCAPPTFFVQYAERVPMHRGRWLPHGSTATDYLWAVWDLRQRFGMFVPVRHPFVLWLPPGQKSAFLTEADIRRFAWMPEAPLLDVPPTELAAKPCQ